ncbi:MAG: hypothetical protein NVS2B14_05520 [Chamaesiphon sp.]
MNLSINDDKLHIELEWFEQLWAFYLNKTLEIPLDHIEWVTTGKPTNNLTESRTPGTFLPGIIKAGIYYTKEGREFWYVRNDRDYLTLELKDEYFKKVIITIDNSKAWVERITQE